MKNIFYHNPKCSKSRKALELLQESKQDFSIREYLKEPLNKDEIESLLKKLNMKATDLLRKKESLIVDENINILTDENVLEAFIAYPKLIERPIFETKSSAIIGRPPENVLKLI